jgi:ribosome-associated protein
MEKVKINTDTIKLDQFIKYCGVAATGSEAKHMIKEGNILVNGAEERRRGRKLSTGDVVRAGNGLEYAVE